MNDLGRNILVLQGKSDYAAIDQLVAEKGNISPTLQADLNRLTAKEIPVDVVFEQGLETLGLQ